jgi:hypothetical protein
MATQSQPGNEADAASVEQRRSAELHANIGFANQYRIELIKTLLAIAAGVLAFTVPFRATLMLVARADLMWAGWIALGLSIVGGMFHMLGWEYFYKAYRDYEHKEGNVTKGKTARSWINAWRRVAMTFQYTGFVIGVGCIAAFAVVNFDHVRKADDAGASKAPLKVEVGPLAPAKQQ